MRVRIVRYDAWRRHARLTMTTASDSDSDPDLGVAITAMNSARTIGCVLDSVADVARRVVVVDSGSIDGTVECCRERGAEVIHRPWTGYVTQKQFAIDQCAEHRWVLLLDSDESVEPALGESIRRVLRDDDPQFDGWEVNRKVWFLGGWLHHVYQPEWRLRLVRGGTAHVAGTDPHDFLTVPGRIGRLAGDLRHDSWSGIADCAARQIRHARTSATAGARGGGALRLLCSPPAALLKQLFIKRGILDGWRGIIAASMAAHASLLKHAFLTAQRHGVRDDAS